LSQVTFDYELLIAGDGEKDYVDQLKQLALDCGNSEKLKWVGWKKKDEKFEFLSKLDLFLPSPLIMGISL